MRVRTPFNWTETGVPRHTLLNYGALLSALMDAMYESAAKGAPVKVKPVPEKL